jgi:hypothetical protein
MNNVILITFAICTIMSAGVSAMAQDSSSAVDGTEMEEVKGRLDGVNESLLEVKSVVDALKKIKVSGYIQSQFQVADSSGISSFAGGTFPQNSHARFQVRRGRLKVNYDNDLTQFVLQIDVTQNGLGIKDAFASIREPWWRIASLTAGVFDRPFGFEVAYSSGVRESPERTRLFQTLFPGERELGAKLELTAEEGWLSYFNLRAGVFNGVLSTANENDGFKDVIGRIGFQLPLEDYSLAIDGGVSLYTGKVTNNSRYAYAIDLNDPDRKFRVDSTGTNAGAGSGRAYYGADLQLYYDLPVLGGLSLRGEYIAGQQPGTTSSNSFYNPDAASGSDPKSTVDGRKTTPLYLRSFRGWYINYVQNVGLSNQLVLKYDVFDPNTDVSALQIGAPGSNHSSADIGYHTFGIGWIHHWDTNVKFVLYYDIVTNEKVNAVAPGSLLPYTGDLKDNVLTVRMQFRF